MKYLLALMLIASCTKKKDDIFKKIPPPVNIGQVIPADTTKS